MNQATNLVLSLVFVSGASLLGCSPGEADPDLARAAVLGQSEGEFVVFPLAMGENPAKNIKGSAKATDAGGGKMKLELKVSGMPSNASHGAHLHLKACDEGMDGAKGGGHYQHMPFPSSSNAMDPAYANKDNEAWLDFTTNDKGEGTGVAEVKWVPTADQAKSIIVHAMPTKNDGTAGPRLACLPMKFNK